MKDTRVAYGAYCSWWDDISKVGTASIRDHSIPCCPKCGGVLFEMAKPEDWWKIVDEYEKNGAVGYHDFIAWLQGKCFKGGYKEAMVAYTEFLK